MLDNLANSIIQVGTRIQNYGYCLANPSYLKVRSGKGCADIYRLLNKAWLPKSKIKLVLDVGANEGQFINTSLALMPNVPVYAFEPNPSLIEALQSRYSDSNVRIFPFALGKSPQEASLNISKFSPSSSLLKGSTQLFFEFPEAVLKDVVKVQIKRLDSLLLDSVDRREFLLKIDVQGFEMDVLKGATDVLEQALVIVCETNFSSLYEGQCAFEEIVSFLHGYNFHLIDIGNPIRSRCNQEVLYLDLAFIKK
jgi:FkbM family methyltransferase